MNIGRAEFLKALPHILKAINSSPFQGNGMDCEYAAEIMRAKMAGMMEIAKPKTKTLQAPTVFRFLE